MNRRSDHVLHVEVGRLARVPAAGLPAEIERSIGERISRLNYFGLQSAGGRLLAGNLQLRRTAAHLRTRKLAADFPKDRSGLAAEREADRIRIVHVAHGSPAWAAGLPDGDVIVSLGGKPVSADHPAAGSRLGFQPAGTRIRLGTTDGRSFTIVLADYC